MLSIEKKINIYIKIKNIIFITIEVVCVVFLYKLISIFFLDHLLVDEILTNFDKDVEVGKAHNVLIQVNRNDNVYYAKSQTIELSDEKVLLNNNIIKSNNINGFAKEIVEVKDEMKIILDDNPIIKIKGIQNSR